MNRPLDMSTYLRAAEACEYCRVSRRTLSRWQKAGRVSAARVNRVILFKKASLDKMIESLMVRGEA